MVKAKYSSQLLDEIAELIDLKKEMISRKRIPIIFDGRQYTVKIPKRVAEQAGIGNDAEFEFIVKSRQSRTSRVTEVTGRIIR